MVHLKVVEADNTVPMRNIALSQDFFSFLSEVNRDITTHNPFSQIIIYWSWNIF